MNDFLNDELKRRGLDATATVLKIERQIKGYGKPCPSRVKYRGELLECMDREGHEACHYHLNVYWK